jgi:hypothetical protein
MNYDMALVAQVLETGEYRKAVREGVTKTLLGDRAGIYWDVLSEFYDEHEKIPSLPFFKKMCPDYEHHPTGDPMESMIQELKTLRLGNDIDIVLRRVADLNVADPWEAKKLLIQNSDEINVQNQLRNTRTVAGELGGHVVSMLKNLRDGSGMLGLPWPFPALNDRTPGIMPGNVIYFYGRHKSKKTWLMLVAALHFEALGHRVLFFTREMSIEELHWRLACLVLGMTLDDFNKGNITDVDLDLVAEIMEDFQKRGKLIFSDNSDGLEGYKSEIDEVQPHIVIHDYWKAMADDAMGDSFGSEKRYVDRTIDRLVDYHAKMKIPVFICGHANRDGIKGGGRSGQEHAWSDHIVRRIHAALRVVKSADGEKLGLVINAGRAIPEDMSFTMNANLCKGFGEIIDCDSDWIHTNEESQQEAAASAARTKKAEPPTMSSAAAIKKGAFRAFSRKK